MCSRRLTLSAGLVVATACSLTSLEGLSVSKADDAGASDGGTTDAPAAKLDEPDGAADAAWPDVDAAPLRSYSDEVLADAPVAYFRFEEDANATVARDETHQHDGTYVGVVELGGPGAMSGSRALHITGSSLNTGVRLADFFDNAADAAFSIEMWLDVDAIDATYRRIFWKTTDAGRGFQIAMSTAENVTLAMYGATQATLKSDTFPTARWVHVAWTFNGRAISLYVDGVLQRTVAGQPNLPDTPAEIFLGETSDGFNQMRGSLDEVALYDKALLEERIRAHFVAAKR